MGTDTEQEQVVAAVQAAVPEWEGVAAADIAVEKLTGGATGQGVYRVSAKPEPKNVLCKIGTEEQGAALACAALKAFSAAPPERNFCGKVAADSVCVELNNADRCTWRATGNIPAFKSLNLLVGAPLLQVPCMLIKTVQMPRRTVAALAYCTPTTTGYLTTSYLHVYPWIPWKWSIAALTAYSAGGL